MPDEASNPDDKPGNLHNNFFHACFSQSQAIRRLLDELAPKEVLDLLGQEPLTPIPGSFVDRKLRGRQTDLLFKARLKKGGDVFVYIVVEHKSFPDRGVLLQLLRYKCNIWSSLCKDEGPLTPIVPVVFYHGDSPWNVAPAFQDMFGNLDGELRELTDQFRYVLIDVGHMDDESLPQDPELLTRLTALKYAIRKDVLKVGLPLLARLLAGRPDMEVSLVLRYILLQHPEIGRDDLDRVLLQHAPELKERVMNGFLQEIFAEGKAEGEAKGKAEGEAKGKAEGKAEGLVEGKAETLLTLLSLRFGATPRDVERAIREADCQTLDRWTRRIFESASLKDVIGN
jgi:predicted transposase/invertase (TIGR01784 family)